MADTYLTRQTLLRRLKSPEDNLSWEEFIKYYENFIYSIIGRMNVPECDYDEVFQMALIKLWKVMPNFDYGQSKGYFRNWLYTVVKNTTYNYFGKHQKKDFELLEKDSLNTETATPDIDLIIEEEWDNHILALAFDRIAVKVSKTAIDAFLQGLEGESVEDAAKRLGLSESSVYVYRKRVKDALSAEVQNLKELLE